MINPLTDALATIDACGKQFGIKTDHIPFTGETLPEPSVAVRANTDLLNEVASHFLNRAGHVSVNDVRGDGKTHFRDLMYDVLAEGPRSEQFRAVRIREVASTTTQQYYTRLLDEFTGYVDLVASDQYLHPTDEVQAVAEDVAGQLENQNITDIVQIDQLEDAVRTTRTFGQLFAAFQSVGDLGDAEPVFPLFLFGIPEASARIDELGETLRSRLVAKDRTLDRVEFDETEELIEGAIGGAVVSAIAFVLSRFTKDAIGRSLLAILLVLAGGAYFGFAWEVSPRWLFMELVQTLILGAVALMGLYSSPYWLAAGWAAHPFWDVGLHLVGPGQSFVPATYPIACVSFDLLVAAYIIIVYRFELLDAQKSTHLS